MSRLRGTGRRLSDVGEFGFLAGLAKLRTPRRGVELGIGDDCAIVRLGGSRILLTTDALIEGVHFRRRWDSAFGLGLRAFAVNASDLAAMGGAPRFALLSLGVPGVTRLAELEGLVRGFTAAARRSGCSLVGGNLSSSPRWMISVALIGEVDGAPLLRSGARVGDHLYVSGELGAAAFARDILLGRRRGAKHGRRTLAFRRPQARLDLGRMLARTGAASAAIDVSDGLLQDLGHLCGASGVGAVIETPSLPVAPPLRRLGEVERLALALGGGEDYELLFSVSPARAGRLRVRRQPITRIGRIVEGSGVRLVDGEGRRVRVAGAGFDHFAGERGRNLR
jgi:thiamine-monophosphate kinase